MECFFIEIIINEFNFEQLGQIIADASAANCILGYPKAKKCVIAGPLAYAIEPGTFKGLPSQIKDL
ncbi:hypothetical protein DCO16_05830 [Polynucleobacter antarcticus]|uniref:Uncharacterized protein n=1 Tax=Polynucleobacter antarcticus TaxID=1743162 RepID=A0A6M9PQJ9_9BURK|nr:hypothetical protein DCO16_05830 [Polynucleobacter antarcticus]